MAKFNKNGKVYWVRRIYSSNDPVEITDIALDTNENLYITGSFSGSAIFGTTTMYSYSQTDMYVAKYDKNGVFSWVRQGGGASYDQGSKIAFDKNGNIYVAGHFYSSATFDVVTLSSEGLRDVFIVKYDTNGMIQWGRRGGGTGDEMVNGLGVDNNGDVVVCGNYTGTCKFSQFNFTALGSSDIFVAKFSPYTVSWTWATSSGGINSDSPTDLLIENDGSVFICGHFSGTAYLGGGVVESSGGSDIFILKYSSAGVFNKIYTGGGLGGATPKKMVFGPDGDIYLIGDYSGIIELGAQSNSAKGGTDIWVGKYWKEGEFEWMKTLGGSNNDVGAGIGSDGSGNLFIGGSFFGKLRFGNATLNSAGSSDIFVARLDY